MRDLDDVRARIRDIAQRLDPDSRYIGDLLALVDASRDLPDFERRLQDARGARHAGAEVFLAMRLEDKILANLITPETTLFRFTEGELEAIDRHLLPSLRAGEARVLIVPCSHGEEAYTIAAYLLKVGVSFAIRAFDIQPALIDEARTGRLTFGYPSAFLAAPGYVAPAVLERIRFEVGDAFDLPLDASERFDLVLCRNFVGYFVETSAVQLVESLWNRVRPGGVLFLDTFCLGKFPAIEDRLVRLGAMRLFGRAAFAAKPTP